MQIVALTRSRTVSAASHAVRTHIQHTYIYVYVLFFTTGIFFAVAFAARILTHTNAAHIQSRKFGFACLLRSAAAAVAVFASHNVVLCCYHCICFVLHILAPFRTFCAALALAHTCTCTHTQIHTHTGTDPRMCTKKRRLKSSVGVVDCAATASTQRFYYISFFSSVCLCVFLACRRVSLLSSEKNQKNHFVK